MQLSLLVALLALMVAAQPPRTPRSVRRDSAPSVLGAPSSSSAAVPQARAGAANTCAPPKYKDGANCFSSHDAYCKYISRNTQRSDGHGRCVNNACPPPKYADGPNCFESHNAYCKHISQGTQVSNGNGRCVCRPCPAPGFQDGCNCFTSHEVYCQKIWRKHSNGQGRCV